MSRLPQACVENNRYRLKGCFHQRLPHTPIRAVDGERGLVGITNPRSMTYLHSYGGEAVFFESLSAGRLLASRCDESSCRSRGSAYLPFRIHCPDCLERCSVIDLTARARKSARIYTYMICERSGAFSGLDLPIRFVNIEIEGVATVLMSYLSVGRPAIGLRVVPIFRTRNPTHTITDLSWAALGTGRGELPEGFSFSVPERRS